MTRTTAVAAVARSWNRGGRVYGVAHGVEEYPTRVGRDLDVIVRRSDIPAALADARDTLVRSGWKVAEPPGLWGPRLVAVDLESGEMLEVHLHERFEWRNVVVADHPAPSSAIGPFAVDPWCAWAKRVLLPVLAGDEERIDERRWEMAFRPGEEDAVRERLPELIGDRIAGRVVGKLSSSAGESLADFVAPIRRAAVRRACRRRPLASLGWPLRALARRLRMPFAPCAPIIAIVGPDGVGKSTLLRGLERTEGWVFLDYVRRHWRPGILPRLGAFMARPAPRADAPNPPRRAPGRMPWFRLLYYALDVGVGTWLWDRPAASRQKLVLYDRCYLDMAVDPLRYGLPSDRGVVGIWRLLPKPDCIVALTADPDEIHGRKGEIPASEIRSQQARWRSLRHAGHVHAVVDAGMPPDVVVARVSRLVLEAFLEVNGAGS